MRNAARILLPIFIFLLAATRPVQAELVEIYQVQYVKGATKDDPFVKAMEQFYVDFTVSFWKRYQIHSGVLEGNRDLWFVSVIIVDPQSSVRPDGNPCIEVTLYKQKGKDPYFTDDATEADMVSHVILKKESPPAEGKQGVLTLKQLADAASEEVMNEILARAGLQ